LARPECHEWHTRVNLKYPNLENAKSENFKILKKAKSEKWENRGTFLSPGCSTPRDVKLKTPPPRRRRVGQSAVVKSPFHVAIAALECRRKPFLSAAAPAGAAPGAAVKAATAAVSSGTRFAGSLLASFFRSFSAFSCVGCPVTFAN